MDSAAAATTQPVRVGVSEFAEVIDTPGTQIIDVRIPDEFAEGHIESAVDIPVESPDLLDDVAQLDPSVHTRCTAAAVTDPKEPWTVWRAWGSRTSTNSRAEPSAGRVRVFLSSSSATVIECGSFQRH